jgi:predicted MFS family arabinose efflux permease
MPHLVNICPFKALDTNILVTATDGVILNEAKNPWLYTSCKDYSKLAIGLIMSIFFLGLAVAAIIGALTIHPEHAGSYSEYGLWAIAVFCLLMSGVFAVRDYRGNKRNRRILDYLALFAAQG